MMIGYCRTRGEIIPGAVAVLMLVFFVKEVAIKTSARKTMLSNINVIVRENKPYLFLIIIAGVFPAGSFNFSSVLLRASDMGIDSSMVPIIYALLTRQK